MDSGVETLLPDTGAFPYAKITLFFNFQNSTGVFKMNHSRFSQIDSILKTVIHSSSSLQLLI